MGGDENRGEVGEGREREGRLRNICSSLQGATEAYTPLFLLAVHVHGYVFALFPVGLNVINFVCVRVCVV